LHQYREQHDWNKYFQPPSHDFPQGAPWVSLSPASPLVEIACGAASVHAHVRILSFRRIQRNKLALPEFWRLTMTDYGRCRWFELTNAGDRYACARCLFSCRFPLGSSRRVRI
jgi:hypothetical protein